MKLLSVLSVLLFAGHSFSYPIVADSEKIQFGEILTLYPDHRDPNKVYFFPNSSILAKDTSGLPMFGLTTWGLDDGDLQEAGAWMTFTARLASDPLQQIALERYLKDNPGKSLAVIPVKQSTLGLETNNEGSSPFGTLFSEMSISDLAGHAEDEIGFMSTLTGVGAKVFKEAVKKPDAFKLTYCYSFDGAGPDMDAKITVKWKRVYDHYRASFSYGGWFRKVRITKEVEKLRQSGDVKWEINGGNADDQTYVKQVAEAIVSRLFTPVLQYVPAGQTKESRKWSFLSFGFSSTHRSELKTETWEMSRRELVERERCIPVNVKDVKPHYNQLVTDL